MIGGAAAGLASAQFDILFQGGRVIDPETGLDAVRDVGIQGGRIVAISEEPLSGESAAGCGSQGCVVINCQGLVISPGFIDTHSHAQVNNLIIAIAGSEVLVQCCK